MLADQHHAVDRQFVAAQRQRFGDGGTELHGRMARRASRLRSFVAHLVDVERHQVHGRTVVRAVPAVAVEKAVDDVLRVRVLEVGGDNGGEFRTDRIAHETTPDQLTL